MSTRNIEPDPEEIDPDDNSAEVPVKVNGLPGGPEETGGGHAADTPQPATSPEDFPGGDEEDREGYQGPDRRNESSA